MLQTLINVILPVFFVIAAGYGTTRAGFFTQSHIDALMKFVMTFAIPCLLFRAISQIDLNQGYNPGLMFSFYTGATVCFVIGILGARFLFRRPWQDSVAIGFCCLFSNGLILGVPITERAYGPDNLVGNFTIISMHAPFTYALGITTMEVIRNRGAGMAQTARAVGRAVFRNMLIVAIILGFAVNFSGLWVPMALTDALDLIATGGLPVALFAMGGVLARYKAEGDLRTILFITAVSLIMHPFLVYSLGSALQVPTDLFRSGVLMSAMAPGVNAYVFASLYGRAQRVAASSVLLATAVSVLSIWIWLGVLGS